MTEEKQDNDTSGNNFFPLAVIFLIVVGGAFVFMGYLLGVSACQDAFRRQAKETASDLPVMVRAPHGMWVSEESIVRYGDGSVDKSEGLYGRNCSVSFGDVLERVGATEKFVTVRYRGATTPQRSSCPNKTVFVMTRNAYEHAEKDYAERVEQLKELQEVRDGFTP